MSLTWAGTSAQRAGHVIGRRGRCVGTGRARAPFRSSLHLRGAPRHNHIRSQLASALLINFIIVFAVSVAEPIAVTIAVAFVTASVFRDTVHDDAAQIHTHRHQMLSCSND